ncbi:MAG TPA: DUF4058 family protein [Vicinamibacteria bacterium]|nr:DUF4058 family protein [Vicinamibacteria bacterium]
MAFVATRCLRPSRAWTHTPPLPLRRGEEEPTVELGLLVHALYDRAGYDLRIDDRKPAVPPLEEADAPWADDDLPALRA